MRNDGKTPSQTFAGPASTMSRSFVIGAALIAFGSFGTLVAMAADDTGVREFLSQSSRSEPPVRRSAERSAYPRGSGFLPSLFVSSARANRQLLSYAPYDYGDYNAPQTRKRAAPASDSRRSGSISPLVGEKIGRSSEKSGKARSGNKPFDDSGFGKGRARLASGVAYCVRLCDGYFFPLSRPGANLAELQTSCSNLCPSAQTRLYSAPAGSEGIEQAKSRGEAYTSLANAFLHRTKVSKACTCTAVGYGLETQDTMTDATFKRGDVFVAEKGLKIYRGLDPDHIRPRDFVPLQTSNLLPASERRKLSELMLRTVPRERASPGAGERRSAESAAVFTPLKTQGPNGSFERAAPLQTVTLVRQELVRDKIAGNERVRNVYPSYPSESAPRAF